MIRYYFLVKILATDETGILCINLNNSNLGDANFYENDPKTIIHVRLLAWHNKLKQT